MTNLIIDFKNTTNNTLFTGRKNGVKARELFSIKPVDIYEIRSAENQLITSSYFLGLLGEELKRFGTPNHILEHLNMAELSEKSKDECIRAIKRGFAQRSLV